MDGEIDMGPPPHEQPMPVCWVELYGTARLLAGVTRLAVPVAGATTLRQLTGALAELCPVLAGPIVDVERQALAEGYIFNRNGRDFLTAPDSTVRPGDRLLLIASVAGGRDDA